MFPNYEDASILSACSLSSGLMLPEELYNEVWMFLCPFPLSWSEDNDPKSMPMWCRLYARSKTGSECYTIADIDKQQVYSVVSPIWESLDTCTVYRLETEKLEVTPACTIPVTSRAMTIHKDSIVYVVREVIDGFSNALNGVCRIFRKPSKQSDHKEELLMRLYVPKTHFISDLFIFNGYVYVVLNSCKSRTLFRLSSSPKGEGVLTLIAVVEPDSSFCHFKDSLLFFKTNDHMLIIDLQSGVHNKVICDCLLTDFFIDKDFVVFSAEKAVSIPIFFQT